MRLSITISFLMLVLLTGAVSAHPSADSGMVRQQVPGSPIWLTPPANFKLTRMFAGFLDKSTGASIAVENLAGTFESNLAYYTDAATMGKLGARIMSKQFVSTPTLKRMLILMQYGAGTSGILKWMLLCGDNRESQLVYASFLVEDDWRLSEPLRKALVGSEWIGKKSFVDYLEGFAVRVATDRGLVPVMRAGNVVVFSTGNAPSLRTDEPQYVIEIRPAMVSQDSIMIYASDRHAAIEKNLGLRDFKIDRFRQVTVRGFNGYETLARGKDADGKEVVYYETYLNGYNGVVTLTGLSSGKKANQYGAAFERMTRSITRTGEFKKLL